VSVLGSHLLAFAIGAHARLDVGMGGAEGEPLERERTCGMPGAEGEDT